MSPLSPLVVMALGTVAFPVQFVGVQDTISCTDVNNAGLSAYCNNQFFSIANLQGYDTKYEAKQTSL